MRFSVRMECSLKGILRENVLQKFISENHWNGLHPPPVSHAKYIFFKETF